MSGLPDVLAAARPVGTLGYVLELDGVARLALTPQEAAPVLGLTEHQMYDLCRSGLLRVRNLRPGSRNGRYLIPVGAIVEYLAGRDDPVPAAFG